MDVKMLDKKYHIDEETDFRCRYIRSDTEYFRLHNHNYYELFMVLKGEVCHLINSHRQNLKEGQILFIRDFDVHDYVSSDGNYFEFINIAFTKETFLELAEFLGEGFPKDDLISSMLPPMVQLSKTKRDEIFFRLTELNQGTDKRIANTKMRVLVFEIFTKYFLNFSEDKTDIPMWLEITYEKMKNPQNFVLGLEKMYEISGKSREHLSRSLKEYYGVSPSEMINDLRLEYSANLLITSNLSATDICYECGFENLSWFYKQFKKKYGVAPAEYRKNML